MSLFQTFLPYSLALYFLFRAKKEKIFLLGIPFLQFMKQSILFEKASLFWMPRRLDGYFLILVWLVITWVICSGIINHKSRVSNRIGLFGPRRILREEIPLLCFACLLLFHLIKNSYTIGDLKELVLSSAGYYSIVIGYILVRGIVANRTQEEVKHFLHSMVVLTTISAALYVLHQGLHIPIYEGDAHSETNFQGALVTRNFFIMSPLLYFAIAYYLSRKSWNFLTLVALGVCFLAIFITFSRNSILITVLLICLSLILPLIKRRNKGLFLRKIVIVCLFCILSSVGIYKFFNIELQYFISRFEGITTLNPFDNGSSTLYDRQNFLTATFEMIQESSPLFGFGHISDRLDPQSFFVSKWTADTVWISILFYSGYIGIALIGFHFLFFGLQALIGFLTSDTTFTEIFWSTMFLSVVAFFLEGFVSWTFLDPRRLPLSFWFFAFMAAEKGNTMLKSEKRAVQTEITDWVSNTRSIVNS